MNSRRAFSGRPEVVRLKWTVTVSDAIFGPILHRKCPSNSGTISRTWSLTLTYSIRLWSRLLL